MTRVGFVGPVPPFRGGIAAHSAGLLRSLASDDHHATVVSWRRQYPRLLYRRPERAEAVEPHPGTHWTLRWWDPLSWWRAGQTLRGSDLVVAPWTSPVHAVHYEVAFRAARAPHALLVHNVEPHESIPGALTAARRLFRSATRLVTHADAVAEQCRALAPDTPVSVVAMPPLLPVDRRPLPARVGPIRLLCFGYLRDYKGTDVALAATRRLVDEGHDIVLTVAGEPWDGDADRWHRLVATLGLGERVRLDLRYVPDTEVPALIADHHVFVAPYRTATQSAVIPQALAAGRPVVATRTGGLAELVTEGVNGALAEPGDAADLAGALRRTFASLASLSDGALAASGSFRDVSRALLGRELAVVRP